MWKILEAGLWVMSCLGQWAVLGAVDLNFCFHLNKSAENYECSYRNQRSSTGNEAFLQAFVKGTKAILELAILGGQLSSKIFCRHSRAVRAGLAWKVT